MNNQYKMPSRQVMLLGVGVLIGIISLALTFFGHHDNELHSRFWSNILHNSVFFTGIALMAVFFLAVSITAWAGWYTVFKRVWEAMGQFLIVGIVLMGIIGLGIYFEWHHLYHWADHDSVANDVLLEGKSGFLNANMYVIFGAIIVGIWYFFANRMRAISLHEDVHGDSSFSHHRKLRTYAAVFLPIAGFTSAAMVWLWVMSIDAHWYSTLFAWYSATSWFVAMIAITIMVITFMKSKGYYPSVTDEHIHDLGKLLFAFSIFWTYLWFSQYMLIWYANIGEETGYFKIRKDEYNVLFVGNVVINFLVPFFVLMINNNKRKLGTILFTSGAVLLGHWLDFFLMIKPGVIHTAHVLTEGGHGHEAAESGGHAVEHAADAAHGAGHGAVETGHQASEFLMGYNLPGFLEIGTFIGFLSLFLLFFWWTLTKAPLQPSKDPFLEESLHHHI